jgi:hypothetical protein
MQRTVRSKLMLTGIAMSALLAGCVVATRAPPPPPPPRHHPAYLHALSDLRAARWLIEHRTGDWAQSSDEAEAVRQIDAAIGDLKQAAYDDGKNIADHPPVDERADHPGRIHEALQYLRKARADISSEEDNGNAKGWRNSAFGHIDAAIGSARRVFHE